MRVLLIDDDIGLCEILQYQFQQHNIEIDTCNDGLEAFDWIRENVHDLIILDRMLPSVDGMTILKKIRNEGFTQPVIMLTALGEISDRVTGLNYGADDYMVKPFAFEELLARIYSISRRPRQWTSVKRYQYGDLLLDTEKCMLSCNDKTCSLSSKECQLFEVFIQNKEQILPRNMLLSHVWGFDAPVEDGNLDNYIYFLRRRLKSVSSRMCIQTIRGVGYILKEG